MVALDIIIALILIIGAIAGLRKGLIAQLFSIAAIFLSSWLAFTFSSAFSEWLSSYIHADGALMNIITFLMIFIGMIILCNLLGKMIETVFEVAMLGWLNRLLGVAFSVTKYALFIGLAIILFHSINNRFNWVDEEKLAESKMYSLMKDGAYAVFPYFESLLKGDKTLDAQKTAQSSQDTKI